MKEFLIFTAIVLFVSTPGSILAIKLIFKNSFMTKIGYAVGAVASFCVITTYLIVKFGLIHILWASPVAVAIAVGAFYLLQKNMNVLHQLSEDLDRMSDLDLNIEFDEKHLKRKDEFGKIAYSMQKMIEQLNKVVLKIQDNSADLTTMANQLNRIAQQISDHAGEQASTTEEIASAMDEMVTTINSNTEQAEYTGELSSKASHRMQKAQKLIIDTLNSAAEVSKKSSVISDIARKTDILSLNAAIEAAKADNSGLGFAVVASEIRKLADKTSLSATEIEKLSKKNIDISKITSKELEKIIPQIVESSELVTHIVSASKEQLSNVESINNSVQQLSGITNNNSAAAEEMSSSSEQLSKQAEALNHIVSVLKVAK